MKLAIVGSRNFFDYVFLKQCLLNFKPTTIVSGGAGGADTLGHRYAIEKGIPIIIFKPDWKKHGKAAGFIRNKDIVQECDELVAFWDGLSNGTKHSLTLAQELNKPNHVFYF